MTVKEEQKVQEETLGFLTAVAAAQRAWRRPSAPREHRLGDLLGPLITPLHVTLDRTTQAQDAWAEVAPRCLAGHSRVCGVGAAHLHVQVDSAAYAYELRLCSQELLQQMRTRCPGMTLRKIKVTVDQAGENHPRK